MAKITHVEIENFRSIRSLSFDPAGICAFVGTNNAGKSNVLAAINLVIGSRWPTDGSIDENDYYGMDRREPVRIRVDVEAPDNHGAPRPIGLEFRQNDDGAYHLFHRFGAAGSWSAYTRKDIRECCPLIRLGVDRSVRQQEATNRWTLLGRLLLEINDELRRSPTRMAAFEDAMRRMRHEVLESVPTFVNLVDVIRTESARQLQRSTDEVDVHLDLHDPWNFYRTLQIVVRECGLSLRAEQMGMGMQSSLTIALLRAYAQIAKEGRAVVAIEEPELFLHPLAQRQFYRLLRDMAYPRDGREPVQVLYATHSGDLVDIQHFDEVSVVRKTVVAGEWTTAIRQGSYTRVVENLELWGIEGTTEASVRARLRVSFDASRTDSLFADAVLLVEGPTEEFALPNYAKALCIDLDALNVAVVSAGGKNNIPTLLNVFQQLRIPCYVIFDGDSHRPGEEAKSAEMAAICGVELPSPPEDVVDETTAVWERDFEHVVRGEVADYDALVERARSELGRVGKPLVARHCAIALTERGQVPPTF